MFRSLLYRSSKVLDIHRVCFRCLGSLPEYRVVHMPSLSPTMETGSICKWNVKIGDEVSEGDHYVR